MNKRVKEMVQPNSCLNLECIVFFGNKETSLSCNHFGSPWRIISYTRNSLVRKSWRIATSSVEASTWRRSTCAGWWPWWNRRWLPPYQLGLHLFSLLAIKRKKKKFIGWLKSIMNKKDKTYPFIPYTAFIMPHCKTKLYAQFNSYCRTWIFFLFSKLHFVVNVIKRQHTFCLDFSSSFSFLNKAYSSSIAKRGIWWFDKLKQKIRSC